MRPWHLKLACGPETSSRLCGCQGFSVDLKVLGGPVQSMLSYLLFFSLRNFLLSGPGEAALNDG